MDMKAIPGSLNPFNFQLSLTPSQPGAPVHVDLSETTFIEVHGLVGSLCLAWRAAREASPVMFTMPQQASVASYVKRMHMPILMHRLGAEVRGRVPDTGEWDQSGWLIELSRFKTDADAEKIAQMVFHRVEQADVQVKDTLHTSVSELASNTWEHANSPDGGAMAAQAFPFKESLLVAVGDPGIGLRQSLTRRYPVPDDWTAIDLALSWMVSGLADKSRGRGLPETSSSVTGLKGTIYVHSGTTLRMIGPRGDVVDRTGEHFPGTLISARIPPRPS